MKKMKEFRRETLEKANITVNILEEDTKRRLLSSMKGISPRKFRDLRSTKYMLKAIHFRQLANEEDDEVKDELRKEFAVALDTIANVLFHAEDHLDTMANDETVNASLEKAIDHLDYKIQKKLWETT